MRPLPRTDSLKLPDPWVPPAAHMQSGGTQPTRPVKTQKTRKRWKTRITGVLWPPSRAGTLCCQPAALHGPTPATRCPWLAPSRFQGGVRRAPTQAWGRVQGHWSHMPLCAHGLGTGVEGVELRRRQVLPRKLGHQVLSFLSSQLQP